MLHECCITLIDQGGPFFQHVRGAADCPTRWSSADCGVRPRPLTCAPVAVHGYVYSLINGKRESP